MSGPVQRRDDVAHRLSSGFGVPPVRSHRENTAAWYLGQRRHPSMNSVPVATGQRPPGSCRTHTRNCDSSLFLNNETCRSSKTLKRPKPPSPTCTRSQSCREATCVPLSYGRASDSCWGSQRVQPDVPLLAPSPPLRCVRARVSSHLHKTYCFSTASIQTPPP